MNVQNGPEVTMPDPMGALIQSRKARVAAILGAVDTFVATVLAPVSLFFAGAYGGPEWTANVKVLLLIPTGLINLIGAVLIASIAYEDGQAKANGTHPSQQVVMPDELDPGTMALPAERNRSSSDLKF
jgi:hypothetical protein